jgi:hypothetical protein
MSLSAAIIRNHSSKQNELTHEYKEMNSSCEISGFTLFFIAVRYCYDDYYYLITYPIYPPVFMVHAVTTDTNDLYLPTSA